MPQSSHMILPSSLWIESGLRFPLMPTNFLIRSLTSASADVNSGCETSTGSSLVDAM